MNEAVQDSITSGDDLAGEGQENADDEKLDSPSGEALGIPVQILQMEEYQGQTDQKRREIDFPPAIQADQRDARGAKTNRLGNVPRCQTHPCQRNNGDQPQKGGAPLGEA